jgi:hypothetical protein
MRVIDKTRVWQVGMSLPPDESKGRRWRTNVSQMVVAPTAERAIVIAREHHGEGEVWSVNHYGGSTGNLLLDE